MSQRKPLSLVLAIAAIFASTFCHGAGDAKSTAAEEANKSNNPLNPAPGLNFQDY